MNRKQIAEHYGVTETTIANWEKEGMPVERTAGIRKGIYDLNKIDLWLKERFEGK